MSRNLTFFRRMIILTTICCLLAFSMQANVYGKKRQKQQPGHPPQLEHAKVEVYKAVGDVTLNIYEYFPADHQSTDRRPAIVFFFGGGWRAGSPRQFEKQCEYLASRGMVAMTADYRVLSRQGVKADRCVADAKSAVRWIRANADRLGIDPNKIVASGGSAGGHVAACTGTIKTLDEPTEDASISSKPNAMILFNPAVVLGPVEFQPDYTPKPGLEERTGVPPLEISPYHHVAAGQPPTLILHGKEDPTVPFKTVEWFTAAMTKAGNRCELAGYDGEKHGFFNYGRGKMKAFTATLTRVDEFLTSLGYLKGEPAVVQFVEGQKE